MVDVHLTTTEEQGKILRSITLTSDDELESRRLIILIGKALEFLRTLELKQL